MFTWRMVRRIGLYLLLLLVVLWCAGSIYQWEEVRQDRRTYQPVGTLYEVKGHRMHIYQTVDGPTTVILAAGWGTANPYVDFSPLYSGLSPHVKVVVYDRFGYGYSDTIGEKRDIDSITDEMHELFRVSGQKPPYVLVGHSLGSLEVIRYAQRFPEEVKGIVMLEGGNPDYYATQKPLTFVPLAYRFLTQSGVARLLYHIAGFAESMADERNGLKALPEDMKKLDRVSTLLHAGNVDMTDEIRQSRRNAERIEQGTKPLQIPMIVMTADYFGKLEKDKAWMEGEASFAGSWSVSGQQVLVKDSSHYVHHYHPEQVIQEILKLADPAS